jgi:hypothetical protein
LSIYTFVDLIHRDHPSTPLSSGLPVSIIAREMTGPNLGSCQTFWYIDRCIHHHRILTTSTTHSPILCMLTCVLRVTKEIEFIQICQPNRTAQFSNGLLSSPHRTLRVRTVSSDPVSSRSLDLRLAFRHSLGILFLSIQIILGVSLVRTGGLDLFVHRFGRRRRRGAQERDLPLG